MDERPNMNVEVPALIEETVRERFPDVKIDSVGVAEGVDFDGGSILRIRIVFDHKGPLDGGKTSGIVRHLRHRLAERGEEAFPIVTFLSRPDAAGMKAEAA